MDLVSEQTVSTVRRRRKRTELLVFIAFVGPVLVLYTFFLISPLLRAVYYSLFDWNLHYGNYAFHGFNNYLELLHDEVFLKTLRFNFLFALLTVFFPNIIALLLAVGIESGMRKGKNLARTLFFMPNVMAPLLIAFTWLFIFTEVFPQIFGILGLERLATMSWFGTFPAALSAMTIVVVWSGTGFLLILYIAALQTVPEELYESADMDGASWLRKLASITVPLVVPTITICLFVSITAAFRTFELSFGMTRGSPMRTTETLSYNIFLEAFTFSNYGVACAKGVILMTITAVVGFFQVRTTSKREVAL